MRLWVLDCASVGPRVYVLTAEVREAAVIRDMLSSPDMTSPEAETSLSVQRVACNHPGMSSSTFLEAADTQGLRAVGGTSSTLSPSSLATPGPKNTTFFLGKKF